MRRICIHNLSTLFLSYFPLLHYPGSIFMRSSPAPEPTENTGTKESLREPKPKGGGCHGRVQCRPPSGGNGALMDAAVMLPQTGSHDLLQDIGYGGALICGQGGVGLGRKDVLVVVVMAR